MAFAWSYSAVDMYELCPKKYYHLKVAKDVKDSDSSWSEEGKVVHKALKERVVDDVALPLPLRHMEPMAHRFALHSGEKHGEIQLALDRNFQPCGWFDKQVYVRAVIDLLIIRGDTALIVDWKTGKVRPKYDQIKLSAAVLAKQMPEIKSFSLAFVWVNYKEVSAMKMHVDDMDEVWADYLERATAIEDAIKTTDFPATEGYLCKYCPVKACPHNGPD